MELTGIDHVILATSDLGAAAARWQALGLQLTPPMRHADASTENSVFFVGDGAGTEFYVELLAVHDRVRAQAEGRRDLLDAVDRGGLYRLMLQVGSAAAAVATLTAGGIEVSSRDVWRDDRSLIGTVVEPVGPTAAGCPFALIAYEGGPDARRARHEAAGLFRHDLPLARLDHLAVIAPGGVEAACAFWDAVLGVPVTGRVTGRGMDIRQLRIGDATLEIIGPDGADSPVRQRPAGLASVTAFEVSDLDAVVADVRRRGFELADPAPGVLPRSRVSTVGAEQLGGLALQLIAFS
ncbi:MAG: VOC family protein [Acidimicrobiales bacterium]